MSLCHAMSLRTYYRRAVRCLNPGGVCILINLTYLSFKFIVQPSLCRYDGNTYRVLFFPLFQFTYTYLLWYLVISYVCVASYTGSLQRILLALSVHLGGGKWTSDLEVEGSNPCQVVQFVNW